MYCDELYAEQIAAEADRPEEEEREYSRVFIDPSGYMRWICPDIKNIYMNEYWGLGARIVKCGKAEGDIYAKDVTCDDTTKIVQIEVRSNSVSSHFDPKLAHTNSGALQLYNVVQRAIFHPLLESARQVMSAS